MPDFATNLRRLMARLGLTVGQVVERSGLDERTIKSILSGASAKPHARTLHQLAAGLNVDVDELFQNSASLAHRTFDRQTNPVVDEVVSSHPGLFDGWTAADFHELYSHFGTGGALTADGALTVVRAMNRKRDVCNKVALLMESGEADVLCGIVDILYRKILIQG
jgi:transcriptional regulator with XRE-family HTH domain